MKSRGKKTVAASTHPDHIMSALIRVDPDEARRRLLAHLREAKMHKGDTARRIGCAHATLIRWIGKLGLEQTINRLDEQARKEGWHHGRLGGRPLGSTVENGAAPRGSRVSG